MTDELDLYGPNGWGWTALAIAVAVVLVAGAGGYRWITTVTPVDHEEAVRLFRQERDDRSALLDSPRPQASPGRDAKRKRARRRGNERRPAVPTGSRTAPPAPRAAAAPAAQERRSRSSSGVPPLPAEGVYSWDTRGYEQVGGARRSFPRESQRIVRRDGRSGWRQHHYFSREREIWTHFEVSRRGARISYQRNKVTFGPITSDSEIHFSPPMLVGPARPRVGQTWEGRWSGDTYGSYRGRTFERRHLNIGGTRVEVFGVHVHMRMDGEIRGEVDARVWIAPDHGMTVRERFVQNVRSGAGSYYAEWSMTVQSLRPRS
jgi:hypothetical protein